MSFWHAELRPGEWVSLRVAFDEAKRAEHMSRVRRELDSGAGLLQAHRLFEDHHAKTRAGERERGG